MVYDDAEKLYAEVRKEGDALIEEAFKAIFPPSVSLADPVIKSKKTGTLVGFNTTFFPRRDIVEVPLTGAATRLRSQVVQTSKDGTVGLALMDGPTAGGLSYGTGMYADCKPVSGMFNQCRLFLLTALLIDCSHTPGRGPLRAEERECPANRL